MKGGVFNECLLMNIFPTGCPHGQGRRGSAKCRQLQTGEGDGGQKSLKMYRHPLWMAPTLTDLLKLRKQRVVLNGQLSSWSNIASGVPKGSILGPLLFLIYINDLSEGLTTNVRLFADNVSLFSVVDNNNL